MHHQWHSVHEPLIGEWRGTADADGEDSGPFFNHNLRVRRIQDRWGISCDPILSGRGPATIQSRIIAKLPALALQTGSGGAGFHEPSVLLRWSRSRRRSARIIGTNPYSDLASRPPQFEAFPLVLQSAVIGPRRGGVIRHPYRLRKAAAELGLAGRSKLTTIARPPGAA